MSLEHWILALAGALLIGLAKGGLPGVGNLTVIIYAGIFGAKASVGILLPVLMAADIVAILVYRRHVEWKYLKLLLPWMCVGVLIGWISFGYMSDTAVKKFIGIIVVSMTCIHVFRKYQQRRLNEKTADSIPHTRVFSSSLGLIGGFSSMIANAAGPVGQLYLLSVGLPKLAFIGTGAWCFFLINIFKLPFQYELGILHLSSLKISGMLMPAAVLGALISPRIVKYIPQRQFEIVVWFFVLLMGIKFLIG